MALGITLMVIAGVLLAVALFSYLHGKMGMIGFVLFIAVFFAVIGAIIIDEANARECVQEVEEFEGASSFHSYNSLMPEASRVIQDYLMVSQ